MATFLIIFSYFVSGVVLMGITIYLYRKNEVFHKLCEIVDVDEPLEIKYDGNFVGLSFFYGFLWPLAVSIAVIAFPYAYIKYLDDNDWKTFDKKNTMCRRRFCPYKKQRRCR